MRPEGFEPSPAWLKARDAAVTPRPRVDWVPAFVSRCHVHFCLLSPDPCHQSGRPDSNRRLRVPETRGIAATLHPDSCAARPRQWAGRRSNPPLLLFRQALCRLSYQPPTWNMSTKKPGAACDTGFGDPYWNPPWSQAQRLRGPKIRRITGKAAAARGLMFQAVSLDQHGSRSFVGRPGRAVLQVRRHSAETVRGFFYAARE